MAKINVESRIPAATQNRLNGMPRTIGWIRLAKGIPTNIKINGIISNNLAVIIPLSLIENCFHLTILRTFFQWGMAFVFGFGLIE